MKHSEHKKKKDSKNHKANSDMKTMEGMPMVDMDEEMGNTKGMCKMVSSKS